MCMYIYMYARIFTYIDPPPPEGQQLPQSEVNVRTEIVACQSDIFI